MQWISEKLYGHTHYYAHHSSIDKEIRENIENFAKNNKDFNFCIVCTSTLELGIDIGSINKIIQIDSTTSVSSLIQRVGRSGRKNKENSSIVIYSTNEWELLQSLACWYLFQNSELETITIAKKPYDLLFHQMLSMVKQYNGCHIKVLVTNLRNNFVFQDINDAIKNNYLKINIQKKIEIGSEGENIVNTNEFYSVFKNEPTLSVIYQGKPIGTLELSEQLKVNETFFLAAQIWQIQEINLDKKQILVNRALDGKLPRFTGRYGNVSSIVREQMLKILKNNTYYQLDTNSNLKLKELRNIFKHFHINDFKYERPIILRGDKLKLYTFAGTKINNSLRFFISFLDIESTFDDNGSSFTFENINISNFKKLIQSINEIFINIDKYLQIELENNQNSLSLFKWGKYLPTKYQIEIIKDRIFDFEGAIQFINNIKLVQK